MGNACAVEERHEMDVIVEKHVDSVPLKSEIRPAKFQASAPAPVEAAKMNPIARPEINDELPDFEVLSEGKKLSNTLTLNPKVHKFHDDSTFMGTINDEGQRTGFGISVTKSGDMYRGDWLNDKPHGNGRYIRSNGDYYQGGFKNAMPHGLGVSREGKSGIIYDGDYVDGTKIGNVKATYPDGGYYIGKKKSWFLISRAISSGQKARHGDMVLRGRLQGHWTLYRGRSYRWDLF